MLNDAEQQLNSILQSELQAANQLSELLKQERTALEDAQVDKLTVIAEQKQPLVEQLNQLGSKRTTLLQSAGFSTVSEMVASMEPEQAKKVQTLLSQVKQAAKNCQQGNHINGSIVNINQQYVKRALSILSGRDVDTSSYGPGGEYNGNGQIVRQPLIGRV